jgi:hypothetical protein
MPSVVDPWTLEELTKLSWSLCASLFVLGFVLFLLGGYGHRFWLVLGTTLAAGILGLQYGEQFGMQRLVAGLLVGLSAGMLALALMRIAIFLGVGALTWFIACKVAPGMNEQLACFLAGGLAGVVLFRFWVMVLTSLLGTVLMTYSGLLLVGRFAGVDVVGLAQRNGQLLNWAILGVALLGLVFQSLLLRSGSGGAERGGKREKKSKKKDKDKDKDKEKDEDEDGEAKEKGGWLAPFFGKKKAS